MMSATPTPSTTAPASTRCVGYHVFFRASLVFTDIRNLFNVSLLSFFPTSSFSSPYPIPLHPHLSTFLSVATLHGQQYSLCDGGLQSGPPRGETAPRDDPSRVLLQTPAASATPIFRPVPGLHQQEHLHQAGLGRHVPVRISTLTVTYGVEKLEFHVTF